MFTRSLKVYFRYFTQFLLARLAYKGDLIASLLAGVFGTISGLLFVVFLIDGSTIRSLGSWSREEVLFVYGFSMVCTGIFSLLAPNLYNFSDKYVIQGQFDRVLLRPLDTLCQVLFESFNLESLGGLIVGLGLLVYCGLQLDVGLSLIDILWFLISALSGAVILLSIFVAVSSLSFIFEDRFGIAAPIFNLINFARYPLPIFNDLLQFILRWIVPFAFVAFYPATHFLKREGFEFFCYFTPVMAVLTLTLAVSAWNFGVSRYSSTGN